MNITDKLNSIVNYLTTIRIYRDPQRVKNDTTEVFRFFPNLQPCCAPYNRGGHMVTLIYLKGTIPIVYQNVTYYIPVVVWIPETYPYVPPVVMLDPTPEMEIVKNHPQVSDNGMCHHQYLSSWTWQSNISQAVKYLCDVYSGYPPLVSKSKPAPPPPIPLDPNRDSPPPYGSSPSTNGGGGGNYSNWNQPPPTYQESIQNQQQYQGQGQQQPPPLPPKPQSPSPSQQQLLREREQQQKKEIEQREQLQREREQQQQIEIETQREKHQRDEALMKCTEKLQILLSQFYDTSSKAIEDYSENNVLLAKQREHLEKEKETLKKDTDYYQGLIQSTTDQIDKLSVWIKENESKDDIDIDVVSSPKDPLSRQLLTLVSEDATIEDMLYYLDKALHSNRITLEEYLKNVRSLAREQFMIRATIKKFKLI
ncbi:Ubiquitin-conjugating protein [Cavenderia fasciculata]|uniref:Ubiquitin-conjugating protein n=1 Tax=Cavenderia fasciculata TaxID=261658 RepID=F4Q6S1_CACFS|nr:Ubiquitin-conjugating protein [Cavenderia fasciculata]EGG16581.1 Ubiquitin-conjugating protein [Cavenderia fasciculata]|eukprot:XP_004354981.1 Ubiquitin-conjugating protein [Cavenderia fasciculata]